MNRSARAIDRAVGLACAVGAVLAAALLLASFALVVYAVVMRYFLNQPVPWSDELVGYLLVAVVMFAAADALRRGEHIAVDLVTSRLGPRAQRFVAGAGLVAVAIAGLALAVGGWQTASFTKMLGIVSTGYLTMPMHLPQLLIPIGGVLLTVAAAGGLVRLVCGESPVVAAPRGEHVPVIAPPPRPPP
jgi:C4-dicarboxylate transporter, DctQ subunit